ncbi:hypothetical protein HME9302_00163 [Alteripontixanthobacter maritimus]|uniref:TonB C-terminal domain-containing protein n=1 Tax=Alteripontixanthobacter maritimus TaxID=2161824 RepID=A0A369Q757_9SPHN|nr:hypothetical protein [Alteripontixanthobacter maritimus]RDC58986.1 hypothetical protein HME9302_00163 [Alteripontixanthobacter maritimus]
MKYILSVTLAIMLTSLLALSVALPVYGREGGSGQNIPSRDIIVSSDAQVFADRARLDLERQLDRVERSIVNNRASSVSGIAQVRFEHDGQGNVVNVGHYRKSGNHMLDRIATRAVQNLTVLEQFPEEARPGQAFLANIVMSDSPIKLKRLTAKLNRREQLRLANRSDGTAPLLAIGTISRPSA